MGMRRNIALDYGAKYKDKIYLYTHWDAEGLEQTLAKALDAGRGRWDDDSYLARIIFSHVVDGVPLDQETGYGLSPFEIDPEFPTLEVDLNGNTVNGVKFEEFIKNPSMFSIRDDECHKCGRDDVGLTENDDGELTCDECYD